MRLALLAATLVLTATAEESPGFRVPALGCPMAHCDPAMSDRVRMRGPSSITSTWFDPYSASPDAGLGCSSNAIIAVCSIGAGPNGTDRPHLKAYDAHGNVLWTSGSALNAFAWTSAPIVNRRGDVIAADDAYLVRFGAGGRILWSTPTPGGRPIAQRSHRTGPSFSQR